MIEWQEFDVAEEFGNDRVTSGHKGLISGIMIRLWYSHNYKRWRFDVNRRGIDRDLDVTDIAALDEAKDAAIAALVSMRMNHGA